MNGIMTFLDTTNDLAGEVLYLAILAAAPAALLAVLVLAINVTLRRWLSAGLLGVLWALVLVRLCVPFAPSSMFSLQNVPLHWSSSEQAIDSAPPASYDAASVAPAVAPAGNTQDLSVAVPLAVSQPFEPLVWFLEHLPLVWLAIGLGSFAWSTVRHARFARRVRGVDECQKTAIVALWDACRREAKVAFAIPLRVTDLVEQPAILGWLRPQLLLPPAAMELEADQLRMIMLHELAHVRRRDVAQNWALVVLRSLHWWNPVYWLASARLRSLREQACDAFVVRRLAAPARRTYSELLLQLAQWTPAAGAWRITLPAAVPSFLAGRFRRRAVRTRLLSLRAAGIERGRWHFAGAMVLLALCAAAGLTDAAAPKTEEDPENLDWLPPAGIARIEEELPRAPRDAASLVTRVYDLEAALARMTADFKTPEEARAVLPLNITAILEIAQRDAPTAAASAGPANSGESSNEPPLPKPTVQLTGTQLVVTATEGAHAELERNLAAWKQSGLGQVSIETRMITSNKDLTSALGGSWQYLEGAASTSGDALFGEPDADQPKARAAATVRDYLPLLVTTITQAQAEQIIESAQGDRRTNVLQAPKITLFNGQKAFISDNTQTPFVVGLNEKLDGAQLPRIKVVEEGLRITLRACQNPDRTRTHLAGRIAMSAIGKVRTVKSRQDGAAIQIPRVSEWSIDVAGQVSEDQSILVGCVPSYEKQEFLYILLTARNVSQPEN